MQQLKKFFKNTRRNSLTYVKPVNEGVSIDDLPSDILEDIFLRVPAKTLCKSVVLVSKHWHDLIESEIFWIEKGLYDKRLNKTVLNTLQEKEMFKSAKRFYFTTFLDRNLVKNPCGFEKFLHWHRGDFGKLRDLEKLINSYSSSNQNIQGFQIENPPGNGMREQILDAKEKPCKCFVTSYTEAGKYQIVELDEQIIQDIKPKIEIKENYGARFDCGSKYSLKVLLVDSEFKERDKFEFEDIMEEWCDAKWKEIKHTFNVDFPVKYVVFFHSGKDTQFWAGNYGSKMTNGSVRIII